MTESKPAAWLFDVFVCHASEDKEEFVRPLASRLKAAHVEVWYDEFTLQVGDSLRRSIELGLARSRFAVVVLSPNFFKKQWPQRELDGLVAIENQQRRRAILPVLHDLSPSELSRQSPILADLRCVSSADGLDSIVAELLKVVRPDGSPLVIARDRLLELGFAPPVVTDQWWLDVVEASNREPGVGFVSEREHWGRWTFPLPKEGKSARHRGERLAWTALQLRWEKAAYKQRISQVTNPTVVHSFIDSQVGLKSACMQWPHYLASYAPQLTIPGLGGDFESHFTDLLKWSVRRGMARRRKGDTGGSALTSNGKCPLSDEFIALRHPTFGDFSPANIACQFVQGDLGGPHVRVYGNIDYAVWLLSSASSWIPFAIRSFLIAGMKEWATWPWEMMVGVDEIELGVEGYAGLGALKNALYRSRNYKTFKFTSACKRDLHHRLVSTRKILTLPETADDLVSRFLAAGFIQAYYESKKSLKV